jgi:tRNA(Ile)-lysidine synthase
LDRFNLLVVPITELDKSSHAIEGGVSEISVPIKMSISIFDKPDNYKVSRDPNTAHFDAGLVEFPLFLRKSQQGDRFMPLGMKQFKKISDLFIDLKMSLIDKENSWLLCNGDDIMWVVGVRIDDRYKIRANTRKILEIKVNP